MQIKNRFTQAVILESPCSTIRESVVKAVSEGADLRDADLCGADLRGANLRGANLRVADLRGADLCGANLRGANLFDADLRDARLRDADLRGASLTRASLRDADLRGADLRGATLRVANLRDADLRGADLCGADLRGATLRVANLRVANLEPVRVDFLAAVLNLPNELEFLRTAIIDGKIDGSTYSGQCACLAGTLAHAKGLTNYGGGEIKNGRTFKADSSSPRERFFLAIKNGDTPETNGASALALKWTDEAIAMRDNILEKGAKK